MKELISTRIEMEMKSDLSKLARIYRVYEPDLYRMAFSQFIVNNSERLNQYDGNNVRIEEEKVENETLIDEVLDTGIHYDRFHVFNFHLKEGTYTIVAKPIEEETFEVNPRYMCDVSFTPVDTDITKYLFDVEFEEAISREIRVSRDEYYRNVSVEELLFVFTTEVIIDLRLSDEFMKWMKEFSVVVTTFSSSVKKAIPFVINTK